MKWLALAVAGLAMSSAAVAAEMRPAGGEEFLAHLKGCWIVDTGAGEGGHYRMCFSSDDKVHLMSYNELYREAFAKDAKYWLQNDKLFIDPVSIELWPSFQSPRIACDARIIPKAELRLDGCGADGIDAYTAGPAGAFAGRPWAYDGDDAGRAP